MCALNLQLPLYARPHNLDDRATPFGRQEPKRFVGGIVHVHREPMWVRVGAPRF